LTYFKRLNTFAINTAAIAVLCACSKSVEVIADFPAPLMEPYPLVAGVRYPADLTDFTHVEDPELQAEWTIKLGTANVLMFHTLLNGMFIKVIELNDTSQVDIDPEIDFIIEPKLEEVEFSVPQQSGTDQFVVWLRYNLKLLQPDGQLISDWRITGYGQEDKGDMGMGSENAMKEAAVTALRDVAANIIISFPAAPGVAKHILKTNKSPANDLPENELSENNEPAENPS
jgi:hypothetical protein